MPPAPELTAALEHRQSGRALDLACGSGRHAIWLTEHGWSVTAVDLVPVKIPGVLFTQTDLERGGFSIEPDMWDLIVCWLYWQPNLLPMIRAGVRPGGIVAMAGKISGRFATSLDQMRNAFVDWQELASGENEARAFFIAEKSVD